jgi:phosphoglycerol transferase
MNRLYNWVSDWNPRRVLPPALTAIFVLLAWRGAGRTATLFADEWYYSLFARLVPAVEALIPSYLYFGLFGLSSQCGPGFLDCVRLLNVLLLVATAPLIYLVARTVTNRGVATAIALLGVLAPINAFSLYFMPETAYFFAFWLFTWSALRFWRQPTVPALLVSAAILALAIMVKVHALFLVPPYCLFVLYSAFGRGAAPAAALRRGAGWVAAALLTAGLIRLGVGYAVAGDNSLTLLGRMYSGQAENSQRVGVLLALLPSALFSARGHFMGLALLFAVPLAALLEQAWAGRRAGAAPARALAVYTVLMFAALMAVTTVFTAAMAGQNAFETDTRLHLRYYDFLFPLLLIWTAARLEPDAAGAASPGRRRWLIALPMGTLVVYAWYTLTRDYTPSGIDSPELQHLSHNASVFAVLTTATLLTLLAWARTGATGARVYLLLWLPLFALVSNFYIARDARAPQADDVFMRAGKAVRQQMPSLDPSTLTIVSGDGPGLFKTMFYLDRPKADILMLPAGSLVNPRPMKKQGKWLLLLDYYKVDGPVAERAGGPGYRLVEVLPDPRVADPIAFSDPAYGGRLRRVEGMGGIDRFGRWSVAKQVVLEFTEPLPREGVLLLKASAYGPNANQEFGVRIGTQRYGLRLTDREDYAEVRFTSDGAQRVVTIEVPQPVSPQALGKGPDERTLGIAITNLSVLAPWEGHPANRALAAATADRSPYPSIDFSDPQGGGLLRNAAGLSPAEHMGRWSVTKQVVLELTRPLPAAGTLRLVAMAYGPNTGRDFIVNIGDQRYPMRLDESQRPVELPFTSDGVQHVVTIDVPEPTSPRTLRGLPDDRALGIAINKLDIQAR